MKNKNYNPKKVVTFQEIYGDSKDAEFSPVNKNESSNVSTSLSKSSNNGSN